MAIEGKSAHRIPMETNAGYSRFRSMGKQCIEGKERKGKERKGKERKGKEHHRSNRRKGKETKGKEHHRRKGQEKGRGYKKGNRFPHRAQTRGYSGKMPIAKAKAQDGQNHPSLHANLKVSQDFYKNVSGVGLVGHSKCHKGSRKGQKSSRKA